MFSKYHGIDGNITAIAPLTSLVDDLGILGNFVDPGVEFGQSTSSGSHQSIRTDICNTIEEDPFQLPFGKDS